MRAAFVTGGSGQIGLSICRRLAKDGFDIAVVDVAASKDRGAAAVKEIEALGHKAVFVSADVSKREEFDAAVEEAYKALGSLDVMINNAGILTINPIQELSTKEFEAMWRVNVQGVLNGTQAAVAKWREVGKTKGAKIINACSDAGYIVHAAMGGYAMTKFAIRALTQSSALEYGKEGITVNAFCPGPVHSAMFDLILKRTAELGFADSVEDAENLHVKGSPLGSYVTTEDVANLVSFLASDDSNMITGQSVSVNAGIHMH